jgi:hypothetical protein
VVSDSCKTFTKGFEDTNTNTTTHAPFPHLVNILDISKLEGSFKLATESRQNFVAFAHQSIGLPWRCVYMCVCMCVMDGVIGGGASVRERTVGTNCRERQMRGTHRKYALCNRKGYIYVCGPPWSL